MIKDNLLFFFRKVDKVFDLLLVFIGNKGGCFFV